MSLRLRIFLVFTALAIIPALPVTWAARTMIHRSLTLVMNPEVQSGLDGGAESARRWLRTERQDFRRRVEGLVPQREQLPAGELPDPGESSKQRYLLTAAGGEILLQLGSWSETEIDWFNETVKDQMLEGGQSTKITYPRGPDRSSLWGILPLGDPVWGRLLVAYDLPADFVTHFENIVEAQQLMAGLKVESDNLRRGFMLPFLLVYACILVVSLLTAALISRRLTRRLQRLVAGTEQVGAGDWNHTIEPGGGDELGKLIRSFNSMTSRLDRQRRRLVDLEKMAAWREMARGLAHEIKNPLTPISLLIQEMQDRYPGSADRDRSPKADDHAADGGDPYREFLTESGRIIEEEIESLRTLSREFSEFARTPEMHKLPGDINSLITDVARLYGRVPVSLQLAGDLPEFPFDPEQLRRVLGNLFENAIAAQEGTAETGWGISVESRLDGEQVTIRFADRGPGVPTEIRGRIFEPHFTTKGSGMGLGLALVGSVVTLHGGTVTLLDEPGAVFKITLPLTDMDEDTVAGTFLESEKEIP